MRTDMGRGRRGLLAAALLAAAAPATHGAWAAEEAAGGPEATSGFGADWQSWRAANDVSDMPSVQRGARNFVSYCLGCHSLKYERWSRLAQDLGVPPRLLEQDLLPPGDKPAQYILTSMPAADAQAWFGKTPPDLSLMARARSQDYLYQFLRTFYVDPASQTGANNLRLPATAMPHVLSELEGLKRAVYRQAAGTARTGRLGSAVSAGVHLARLAGEARVLEGRALSVALGRRLHRALPTDGSQERKLVEQTIHHDTVFRTQ